MNCQTQILKEYNDTILHKIQTIQVLGGCQESKHPTPILAV